jgi:hypothetical protein
VETELQVLVRSHNMSGVEGAEHRKHGAINKEPVLKVLGLCRCMNLKEKEKREHMVWQVGQGNEMHLLLRETTSGKRRLCNPSTGPLLSYVISLIYAAG